MEPRNQTLIRSTFPTGYATAYQVLPLDIHQGSTDCSRVLKACVVERSLHVSLVPHGHKKQGMLVRQRDATPQEQLVTSTETPTSLLNAALHYTQHEGSGAVDVWLGMRLQALGLHEHEAEVYVRLFVNAVRNYPVVAHRYTLERVLATMTTIYGGSLHG